MPSDSDPGGGEVGRGRHDAARPAGALPLTISRVEWEPGRAGAVRLRVQGRWTTTSRAFSAPRLVVEHAGRVRRLRPVPIAAWAREALAADEYRGVFSVPALGAGEPPQRLVLEIGGVTIRLPEPRPAAVSEVPYARNTAGAPQERLERDAAEAATLRERLLHDAAQAAMLHDRLERETVEVSALRERLEAAAVDTVAQRERFEREAAGLAAERERLARETAVALARREALGGAEPQAHDAGAMAAAAQRRVDRVEGMLHELAQRMTTVERAARDESVRDRARRDELEAAERDRAGRAGGPDWITRGMRALAARDPAIAGRTLLALLPAQAIATPEAVRYDLVGEDLGCLAVTVTADGTEVVRRLNPRSPADVDATIEADAAALGRLVASRSRLLAPRRAGVKVRGAWGGHRPLIALARQPLGLRDLETVGIQLEPDLLVSLIAGAVDPSWTIGHRFTVAVEDAEATPGKCWYLHVNDGSAPSVSGMLPLGRAATIVRGPARELPAVLCGDPPEGAGTRVAGDPVPLAVLQGWVARLEAGR